MKTIVFSVFFLSICLLVFFLFKSLKVKEEPQATVYSESEIQQAKKNIIEKKISSNNELSKQIDLENDKNTFTKDRIRYLFNKVYVNGKFNQKLLIDFYEISDRALLFEDIELRKETLRLLLFISLMREKDQSIPVYSNESRNMVLVSLLKSEYELIRMTAFDLAAWSSSSDPRVLANLKDSFLHPQSGDRLEHLHYTRTLGNLMRVKGYDSLKNIFIEQLSAYGTYSGQVAKLVEIANQLSLLDQPPQQIIPYILGMLEGQYFGDPMLLDAVSNYSDKMVPYLPRLHQLELEVNNRILHGRDNKGIGSSTFSRARYRDVLDKLETFQ